MRMRSLGGDGPEVTYVPCDLADTLERADDVVDGLLGDWRPEDIALLTTGSRHDEQVSRQDLLGQDGYWDTFWDEDQVFYGHVLGFKGLERKVVVLAANESGERERSRERLYVGLSRATDKLVVVGPPDLVTAIGGPEVAKRLGIDEALRQKN
ncbi:ATP-binding domain-containing protein [Phycicoccus sp. BSK3Z-2]|uniref:ATP-binding domain-containing protein n=1 Tax=Phycicoccus avicenniae TaxID=2828860 RepID=A0A941DAZ6_9MICO|nr:ATP-binding domain-containing protein [Phycicoccus avicenniae]MBR7744363.1 ATP-binding domain-containing protein [Phycicoccus avicenniae]